MSPPGEQSEGRLDSWKEIAAYLKRDVTTVQRWEKREAMPVHRHQHETLGSVYAFRSELDAWTRSRTPSRSSGGTDFAHSAWRNPLEDASFQNITEFGGAEGAAAISRDGRFAAFLSDRDGRMDVWVTQVGTGRFYNLTRGRAPAIVNPLVRTVGFAPDASLVTFWTRGMGSRDDISVWALPTLGGEMQPYLEGAAEFDWSADASQLVYHTSDAGDPMFIRGARERMPGQQICVAPEGQHAHFPLWSPSGAFVYFVQGSIPDRMDIWRITPSGGAAERVTAHDSEVSHPVLLDDRTLLYIATAPNGAGPRLYATDLETRVPHRIGPGLDRYTSLSASADGRRLVATRASRSGTLWRLPIGDAPADLSAATPIPLTTGRGFLPRLGTGYLLYVSSTGTSDCLWKLADGASTELWRGSDARVVGGPEIAPDGQRIVFSVAQRGRTALYVISVDGTNARMITESLPLIGAPTWAPDGESITSAADVDGIPVLFRISLTGEATPLVRDYSVDPVWSPRGDLLLYSAADVGAAFRVRGVAADGSPYSIPRLSLPRGARRLRFLRGQRVLVVLRGEIHHKDLWSIDLDTGAERQLTRLAPDFSVRDFDVSPDGREVVLERVQERSDVILIDRAPVN